MIDNALDFIKNILTDFYPNKEQLKADALQVYTVLIQSPAAEVSVLKLPIPNSNLLLSIPAPYYLEARKHFQEGRKINAIKTIRVYGWYGNDKEAHPDLKAAKDFVEGSFSIPPSF